MNKTLKIEILQKKVFQVVCIYYLAYRNRTVRRHIF